MIDGDIKMFFLALNKALSITEMDSFFASTVDDAQTNITGNIALVNQIVGEEITQQALSDFFKTVKLYTFGGYICEMLAGLSSLDGTRQYVSEKLMDADNTLASGASSGFTAFQRNLEHEYIHNISRWKYPLDHRRISPAKNANLRSIGKHEMIEAGNFYEERTNGKIIKYPSPFCLNLFLGQE
jgi:hypothetical protein